MKKILLLHVLILITSILYKSNAQEPYIGVYRSDTNNIDYHHFTRNNAAGAAVYINQISTGPILRLSSGIYNPNQEVKFTFENSGNFGMGTKDVTEKQVLYNTVSSQVATQYGNVITGIGNGNGFILGIESAGNGIIWNRENNFIRFGTNEQERMRISANGYVGIGTESPASTLHVGGNGRIASFGDDVYNDKYILIRNHEEHGIAFGLNDGISLQGSTGVALLRAGTNKGFAIATNESTPFSLVTDVDFVIDLNGNVAIGTTTIPSGYKLAVNGKIIATEIKVETGWADFVFEPDYNLMSLKDLETFIQENKHLPEIPTSKEVEENGISVGEMNAKLLQKIEELTLYTLKQQELINSLLKRVENLENK